MKGNTMDKRITSNDLSDEQAELIANMVRLALRLGQNEEDFIKYTGTQPADKLLSDLTLMLFYAESEGLNSGVTELIDECYDAAVSSHSREVYASTMISKLNERENIGLESVKSILRIAFRSIKRLSVAMDAVASKAREKRGQ